MSITAKLLRWISVSVLSLGCAAAYADVQFEHSSLVRFADLNLQKPGDVAKLYGRIATAADKLCGPRSLTGAYAKSATYASCYADTVAQAVARVNQAPLTTYYERRMHPSSREISVARE
jgi:UrcA family protein